MPSSKSTSKLPLVCLWLLAGVGDIAYFISIYIELIFVLIICILFFYLQQRAVAGLKLNYKQFRNSYMTYLGCIIAGTVLSILIYYHQQLLFLLILSLPFVYISKLGFFIAIFVELGRLFRAKPELAV